jgi:hypothetical protein
MTILMKQIERQLGEMRDRLTFADHEIRESNAFPR